MRQNSTTADRILQLETEVTEMKRAHFLIAAKCPDGFGVQGTSCEFYQRLRTEMESQKTQPDEIKTLTNSIVAMRSKEAELRRLKLSLRH